MWYFTPITPLGTGIMFPNYTRCMVKFQGMFFVFTLKFGGHDPIWRAYSICFKWVVQPPLRDWLYVLLTTDISLAFWHKATQILDAQPTISLCNWSNLTHVPYIGAVWVDGLAPPTPTYHPNHSNQFSHVHLMMCFWVIPSTKTTHQISVIHGFPRFQKKTTWKTYRIRTIFLKLSLITGKRWF